MVQQLLNDNRGITEDDQPENESEEVQVEEEQEQEKFVRPDNYTVTYFKEMAQYSTLSSEEEISLGSAIRDLRTSMWKLLLRFQPVVEALHEEIMLLDGETAQLQSFFNSLKNASKKNRRNPVPQEHLEEAAQALNRIDLDEVALGRMLELVTAQSVPSRSRVAGPRRSTIVLLEELDHLGEQLRQVKHQFINANLRLVIAVARRYNNGPMNLIDLIQEGNIGLMKAVDRFDPDRGYRFSTYAAWWIRHAVSRASADKGRTVRLPVHFIESYQQLSKIKKELQLSLDRVPTAEEVAKTMGISRRKVDRIEGYLREGTLSLDRKVNNDDSRSFMELLEDPKTERGICSEIIHERELLLSNAAIIEVLSPMERDVILKRYGLDSDDPCTLKEIGCLYQLSRERIRQIQENALAKIRKYFSENGML